MQYFALDSGFQGQDKDFSGVERVDVSGILLSPVPSAALLVSRRSILLITTLKHKYEGLKVII